jgi:cytoskeletal protein CcmA (bactofilin family)
MDTPERDKNDKGDKNAMSMIGADIVVTGNIEAKVDLHIEGRVNGDVRCATLILGENSSVNGSIYADRVRVSGTVEGAVETKDLAVEATARVVGDVTYDRLRVANGGVIEGSMKRRAVEESASDAGKLKLVGPSEPAPALAAGAPARAVFIE